MPIDNPRFLEAGAAPGEARAWRLVARVTTVAVAMFDGRGWEAFTWTPHVATLGPSSVVVATLAGERVESFDAWARGAAMQLADASVAAARWADGGTVERFGGAPLARNWALAQPGATFPDGPREVFTAEWPGTTGGVVAWDDVTALPALFGAAAGEDFASGWPFT